MTLSAEQYDIRLRRLEGSMLRLERINLEILVMLQKLVNVASASSSESAAVSAVSVPVLTEQDKVK
jgi:hypothetical protein